MYTLKDIAKKAGVSQITVSRVVNNYPHISEKTKQKVMKVIMDIDYTPNQVARSLVTKKSKTIGLLLSNICNPFYPSVVLGAEHRARELGYSVIICNAHTYEIAMHNLDVLIQKQVDSFIITSAEFDSDKSESDMKFYKRIVELSNNFEKKDKFFCFINNCIGNVGRISKVFGDNLLGGKMATEHLCELGHRNIALITGRYEANKTEDDTDFWSLRNEGYKSVLEKYGIPFNPNNVFVWSEDEAEGGYYSAKKILELTPRPTAVFAANDTYAIGAISAFHEAGLKLPEDISVVGLDGIDEGQIIYPKLTTVSLQREELGRIAVEHLVKRINHECSAQDIIVKPTLKIGQSAVQPMLL